jgi:hypothetical protein
MDSHALTVHVPWPIAQQGNLMSIYVYYKYDKFVDTYESELSARVRANPIAAEDSRLHGAKQRFEVYVCTAAERGYALEAWRILDPKVSPCAELLATQSRAQNCLDFIC